MGIRDKRLARAIDTVLKRELQKGNLPSSREFISAVNRYLSQNDLTRPSYELRNVRKGELARPEDYNRSFDQVYNDLEILYSNIIEQHNLGSQHFNKFETDKSKLDYELNELEAQLRNLIMLYGENGFLASTYDVFDDMSKIDTAHTTAEVDIKNHQVGITSAKTQSRKIIPNATASFVVNPEVERNAVVKYINGSPIDALSDKRIHSWKVSITTPHVMEVSGYFYVDFAQKQRMNKISLDLHTVKKMAVGIEFTPDNLNWIKLPNYEEMITTEKDFVFSFPAIEAYRIRILFKKSEVDRERGMMVRENPANQISFEEDRKNPYAPDVVSSRRKRKIVSTPTSKEYASYQEGIKGLVRRRMRKAAFETTPYTEEMQNEYIIGIKNISFYDLGYGAGGTLQSLPLKVSVGAASNFTINQVSLDAKEEILNGTDIDYFVALPPQEGEDPEWRPISPVNRSNPKYSQVIDFKNITNGLPSTFSIDPDISVGEYELQQYYANGIRFYKIGEIKNKVIIPGSERLFVGKNTWSVQSFIQKQEGHSDHIPSPQDWSLPQDIKKTYLKMQDGKPGILMHQNKVALPTNYMFKLGIFSDKKEELVSTRPVSTEPIAIFLNGAKLFEGIPTPATKVNYLFKNGWNELVVLVYTSKGVGYGENGEAKSVGMGCSVDLNLDPRSYGSQVYAEPSPMEKVALFDLRYNVRNTDLMKYAVEEVNGKQFVIVNHAIPGLEYDFYFHYAVGDLQDEILLKAELKRDLLITDTTPRLQSYTLRFS